MNEQKHTGRGKVWAWIAGILVVILVGGYAGWHFFKKDLASPHSKVAKPLLTEQLKKMVIEASDSLYHIEYDKFDLNIDSGHGLITNFRLIPDTAVYQRLVAAHKAPNTVLRIHTDSLILNQFSFAKTPEGRRFNIAGIVMRHPVIRVVNKRMAYNDTPSTAHKSPTLVKLMKDVMQITAVQKLTITNLLLTYVNRNEAREKETVLKHWNIQVNDFRFDHVKANSKDTAKANQLLYMKAKLLRISTPDSLYRINFENFLFSPDRALMSVQQFSVVPRLSREAFYKAVKYDKDRYHFVCNNMVMGNIDIDRLLRRQQIHIGTASIGSSWIEVFNSYYWPKRKPPIRPDAYPHQKLQKLAFDVTIDKMLIHNGYFQYIIAAHKSEENAKLFMTHISSVYTNITNNTARKKQYPYTEVRMQARMMGTGDMHAYYKFNLNGSSFSHDLLIGPMDGRAYNPLSKALSLVEVKSANMQKTYMHIDATRYHATGHLDLYYTNFKINLLKHDDKDERLKKRGVLSFLTNTFMPNDNPKKNGKFRQGPINVTRDPRESFFALMWKCSLDGMSSATMGFDQKKDKPNENFVVKVLKKIIKPHKKEISKKPES